MVAHSFMAKGAPLWQGLRDADRRPKEKYAALPDKYRVAVEIETEAKTQDVANTLLQQKIKEWSPHPDGSLRMGVEFVSIEPVAVGRIDKHLDVLFDLIKDYELHSSTPRTSTHVHFNALDCTVTGLCAKIAAFLMFEPALIRKSGEGRTNNLFCMPYELSLDSLDIIVERINIRSPAAFSDDNFRYAWLNLASVYKHGTLEVRCFKGTLDKEEIVLWVRTLEAIRTMPFHPVDTFANLSEGGLSQTLRSLFPLVLWDWLEPTEDELRRGMRLSQYFCRTLRPDVWQRGSYDPVPFSEKYAPPQNQEPVRVLAEDFLNEVEVPVGPGPILWNPPQPGGIDAAVLLRGLEQFNNQIRPVGRRIQHPAIILAPNEFIEEPNPPVGGENNDF